MLGFKKDIHCLKFEGDVMSRLAFKNGLYEATGKHLKVLPLSGEGGHPAAPERMLEVLHSLDGRWSFEIWRAKGRISFHFWAKDESDASMIKSEIAAHYSNAEITEVKFPTFPGIIPGSYMACARVKMVQEHFYPFETKFVDDPLKGILMPFSYMDGDDNAVVQVILTPAKGGWSSGADKVILEKTNGRCVGWIEPQVVKATDYEKSIANAVSEKAKTTAFQVEIRIFADSDTPEKATTKVRELARKFSQFNAASGNKFDYEMIKEDEIEWFIMEMGTRAIEPPPMILGRNRYAMTIKELACIVHLPRREIDIPDIEWANKQQRMAPVITRGTQRENGVVVCQNTYRNRVQNIVLSEEDLNTHLAIFGKTGTGKSTLIASMALEKINNGESVVVIDPHGDLIKEIVPRIDSGRLSDVILVEPSTRPLRLNAIEIPNRKNLPQEDQELLKEVVIDDTVSTIKNVFYKDKPEYWGPRLDHVFGYTARGLLEKEGTNLVDMYFILTDNKARLRFGNGVNNRMVKNFIENELPQRKFEDIDTTVTKVSKFAVNNILRKNLCQRNKTFDIKGALDGKKVMLFDLSKGSLGENNSKILGSAIVTQIWMSILQRGKQPESQRTRTYLYVDEFQNFASQSFMHILSESRKYKLSLTLATQYTEQVSDDMWKGIEANVNTFVSFTLGATDAQKLAKVYTDVNQDEFIRLDKYNVIIRKGNTTTQGVTNALCEDINRRNIEILKKKDNGTGFVDDSLVSEYIEEEDINLKLHDALYALKLTKKRGLFSQWEIEKELEKKGYDIEKMLLERSLTEQNTKGWIKRIWNGNAYENGLTQEGIDAIKDLLGTCATAGNGKHKDLIMYAYCHYTLLGCTVNLIRQGGALPLPDLEIVAGECLNELSGGRKVNIEVECTTWTKPAKILQNLAKALNENRKCIFVAEDRDTASKICEIIKSPYREKKNGVTEYYTMDGGKPFVPEVEYPRPLEAEDWEIMVLSGDSGLVRFCDENPEESDDGIDEKINAEANKEKETVTNIAKIEKFLKTHPGFHRPKDIRVALGMLKNIVTTALGRLVERKVVLTFGDGKYIHRDCAANCRVN